MKNRITTKKSYHILFGRCDCEGECDFCGAHDQPVLLQVEDPGKSGRFDIEDTRAGRIYRQTSKLCIFEVGTFLSTIIGTVAVVSYLCFMCDIAG